ncbi:TAXI family TRAP transporter solute-binding subunit [Bacillus carboniphilus]|uniref:TAXI family TRAP transporter solute-binding subunit n=1 Tax=Bacillus carboniphilus TaxID=86663 RepID=A0ABP3FX10_9BACI
MHKFKSLIFVSIALTMAFLLSGCSNQSSGGSGNDWPKGISVSSATIGGTFHVYATGWSDIVSKKLNIQSNVEATGGPIPNIELVDRGESEIGLVTMGPAYEGYNGIGWAEKKYENIRTLFPMYKSYLHWWAMPGADIKSIEDFAGKRIGTGAAGGTPDYYGQRVFEDLGIELGRIVNGGYNEYTNLMRDGQLDVASAFAPTGHPTAVEMISTDKVNIVGVGEKSAELAGKYGITHGVIEANSYEGQTEDIPTLTIYSAFITHKDLSEDFVYELVKATFESKEELIKVHQSAAELDPKVVPEALAGVPMHPGAIRYYEEIGIELPDSVYPKE